MSRIPPASLRLTGALLNYNQVATSGYYFNNHTKEAFMYDRIVRQLAKNMGFVASAQRGRKRLPLLEMGVLPIYTLLRAKMCYSRCLTKSYHWFRTRLFRGARSDTLCYQNASLCSDLTNGYTISDCSAAYKATPRELTKNGASENLTILQILRKNVATSIRHPKNEPFTSHEYDRKKKAYFGRGTVKQPPAAIRMLKKGFLKRSKMSKMSLNYVLPGLIPTRYSQPQPGDGESGQASYRRRFLSKQEQSFKLKFDRPKTTLTRTVQIRANTKKNNKSIRTAKTKPHVWSKLSLFGLFCLEQIIGKANHGAHKTVFCPGTPFPSVRTSNKKTYGGQRKYKTFYDIQLTRQLNSDQFLKIRKTHNLPRSYIDLLKPTDYLVLKDVDGGTDEVVKANVYTRQLQSGIRRKKPVSDVVQQIDFDRAFDQAMRERAKFNVVPKYWISRRFNTPMMLNLFCVVQGQTSGRFCAGHQSPYRSLGISSSSAGCCSNNTARTSSRRLKSSFIFEFDVHSKSSNTIKSLRPAMSLRF